MGSIIHEIAKAGFGNGTNELYDRYIHFLSMCSLTNEDHRARPTYPAEALSFMRSKLPETGKLNIIEYASLLRFTVQFLMQL